MRVVVDTIAGVMPELAERERLRLTAIQEELRRALTTRGSSEETAACCHRSSARECPARRVRSCAGPGLGAGRIVDRAGAGYRRRGARAIESRARRRRVACSGDRRRPTATATLRRPRAVRGWSATWTTPRLNRHSARPLRPRHGDRASPDRAEFFYAKCGCYRGCRPIARHSIPTPPDRGRAFHRSRFPPVLCERPVRHPERQRVNLFASCRSGRFSRKDSSPTPAPLAAPPASATFVSAARGARCSGAPRVR